MTDKPITQADLDAFRAEIVGAMVKAAVNMTADQCQMAAGFVLRNAADRLATPPKPNPDLLNRYEWELIAGMNESGLIILSSVVGGNLLNLARAIVSGEVDLPTWREK